MAPMLERFASPGKGNGLRATTAIKSGKLLFSSDPLASCVSTKVAKDVCHRCFARHETLLRCSQCKMARYCNITCQKQAWSDHKRECKCLQSILPRIPTDSVRLAARIIFALMNPAKSGREELYSLNEHESHLSSMPEQKKQGLSQLASMLEIYLQQEVPELALEMTSSALPQSCWQPLDLIAKIFVDEDCCHRTYISNPNCTFWAFSLNDNLTVNQHLLRSLCEQIRGLWQDMLLRHNHAPVHRALSGRQFLAKTITILEQTS